jgi:hypothetical protein
MDSAEKNLLLSQCRVIAHLRAQIASGRFGLIFGAGVSKPLDFPNWSELVERISKDKCVNGEHVVAGAGKSLSDISKTQMLFQHYRTTEIDRSSEPLTAKLERRIQGQWRRIIHSALYEKVAPDAEELKNKHPYLRHWIPVIRKAGMTVNYNFDDTVQRLMLLEQVDERKTEAETVRPFETVWNANLPFRSTAAILYHPNGFLPHNLLENPSETLVFSEDSFADQLIESMAGHHASLLHHLSKTTCLFVGLSLQDPTLRHLLRQSAVINPGHYHYYVHFVRPGKARNSETEKAIRDANFEIYNLVTLFLGDEELAALGKLLVANEAKIRKEAEEIGAELNYFFYLSGAIGAGKTTCLGYLGSFKTYEEWMDARPKELAKSWKELTSDERSFVDGWIASQFEKRNSMLIEERIGIHVCDRTPLDPLSFNDDADMPSKAKAITDSLSPGKARRKAISGQVILLHGNADDLEARVVGRHKQSSAALIYELQERLGRVFECGVSPTIIETFGLSIAQVVKRVSRVILLEEYAPMDLAACLKKVEKGAAAKGAR